MPSKGFQPGGLIQLVDCRSSRTSESDRLIYNFALEWIKRIYRELSGKKLVYVIYQMQLHYAHLSVKEKIQIF